MLSLPMRSLALLVTLCFFLALGAAQAQPVAIVGGTVHPISSPPIKDGVVLLDGDRIAAVGARGDVTIPSSARRIDATDMIVTPGLIDVGTATGLVEVSNVASTRDNALRGDPIRAAFRVTDGINPHSSVIPVTRLGGVTTVAVTPSGGAIAGQSAVLDLVDGTLTDMLVRDGAGLYAAFSPDGADATGGSRGGLSLRLREAFDDAAYYRDHPDAFSHGATRPLSMSRLDLEAVHPALDGTMPLVVRAARASDIMASLRLAAARDLRWSLKEGTKHGCERPRLPRPRYPSF